LEACYNFYNSTRHTIFHFGDILGTADSTRIIGTKTEADELIKECLRLMANNTDTGEIIMKEYVLRKIGDGKYYLFCLSFYSILNYLRDLGNDEEIKSNKGILIIDQFLVAGNGENRFLTCNFSNGVVEISSAKNFTHEAELDALALNILQDNFNLLDSSILTRACLKTTKSYYFNRQTRKKRLKTANFC
jgi:hypothetical protein